MKGRSETPLLILGGPRVDDPIARIARERAEQAAVNAHLDAGGWCPHINIDRGEVYVPGGRVVMQATCEDCNRLLSQYDAGKVGVS